METEDIASLHFGCCCMYFVAPLLEASCHSTSTFIASLIWKLFLLYSYRGFEYTRCANNRESLVVGTPEKIKSIILEKFRASATDQTAISQLEGDVSAMADPAAERGLPTKIDCSYDSRTGTWTWKIAIGIEGGRY